MWGASLLTAAVGCDLNDPDRDVRRLFPESTGYRTEYVSIARSGGEEMLQRIETRLGDRFQGLFETMDVPYTMYRIFRGETLIGYIHGVNQKGQYGGIQVFLALELDGRIRAFYIQKLTSRGAKALRSAEFAGQFAALNFEAFRAYDVPQARFPVGSPGAAIRNPAPGAEGDFRAILRGVKKNLILIDEFMLGNRFEKPTGGAP
jgi:hypothetical protein